MTLAPSSAQGSLGGGGDSSARIEGRYKIVPLPYLNYNRSVGLAVGALPMVMFNPVEKDLESPSSMAGLLGMYTTNDSWFALGFAQLFFDEDNWRFTAAGGRGSVNFQFYLDNPINQWIPYNAQADLAFVEAQRRVWNRLYVGVSYLYMYFRNSTEALPGTQTTALNGLGLKLAWDSRDNFYYPRRGVFGNIQYFTFPTGELFGNEDESQQIDIDYNHYWGLRSDQDVLAARVFVGLGIGELSFNQQYIVGRVDIRGYTQGEFRGDYLLAAQAEYRWNFSGRWGAVGFAGLATVYEGINESDNGRILPGAGAGIRFTAFEDNHMNVGLDAAVGDGDWGLYFRIGEAF